MKKEFNTVEELIEDCGGVFSLERKLADCFNNYSKHHTPQEIIDSILKKKLNINGVPIDDIQSFLAGVYYTLTILDVDRVSFIKKETKITVEETPFNSIL